jgi:hypothetical protein
MYAVCTLQYRRCKTHRHKHLCSVPPGVRFQIPLLGLQVPLLPHPPLRVAAPVAAVRKQVSEAHTTIVSRCGGSSSGGRSLCRKTAIAHTLYVNDALQRHDHSAAIARLLKRYATTSTLTGEMRGSRAGAPLAWARTGVRLVQNQAA